MESLVILTLLTVFGSIIYLGYDDLKDFIMKKSF